MLPFLLAFTAALADEPDFEPFRPGHLQVQVGLGLQPPSKAFWWWWTMAEGFYPLSANADLGLVDFGKVSLSIGADASIANQPLLNPMLRLRAFTPWWAAPFGAPTTTERIASFDWRTLDRTVGGRLALHFNRAPGRPYLLLGGQNTWHRVTLESRDDPTLGGTTVRELPSLVLGAGASSLLPSGFLVGIEGRYHQVPLLEVPGMAVEVPDGGDPVVVPGYMRAPRSFVLRASVGYRLGGRRKVDPPLPESTGGS